MANNTETTNPQQLPQTGRNKYPHMFKKDIASWEKFLAKHGEDYIKFDYDVKCGEPCKIPEHWAEPYRKDAEVLSRLRIDVVGEKENGIDIIEVKPRLNQTAIGQVLTYKEWYIREHKPTKPVRAVIVAEEGNPNIEVLTRKLNITFIQV